VPAAGLRIPQHPDWPALEELRPDRGLVYQRFGAAQGMAFVAWGPDATVDAQLAQLDERGERTIEADEATELLGGPARRVRVRLRAARTRGHRRGPTGPEPLPAGRDEMWLLVGGAAAGTPVLVGFRGPEPEVARLAPLLAHIVEGVRPL
jgi:hypothetical protein